MKTCRRKKVMCNKRTCRDARQDCIKILGGHQDILRPVIQHKGVRKISGSSFPLSPSQRSG